MLTPKEVVAEVIQFRRSAAIDTSKNKDYSHDVLCRILHEKLSVIGDCFGKYQNISYVVQGPRDQGVDVLLKLGSDSTPERYVGFQVKSFNEIKTDDNLSKNLKAGLHDAKSHYGSQLVRYYILFFGDSTTSQRRIAAITNEFTRDEIVRVLDERYCRALLDLDYEIIAAVVDHFLRKDDLVLKQAKHEVVGFQPNRIRNLLKCLSLAYESGETRTSISDFHHATGLTGFTIDSLDGFAVSVDQSSGNAIIMTAEYPAIRALYFDLQVRHDLERPELIGHLHRLLTHVESKI